MKKRILGIITLALTIGFASCDNDDKVNANKPEINYMSPEADADYELGNILNVIAAIKAEAGIKEIKIDIHYGEGHTHDVETRNEHIHENTPENAWITNKVISALGKTSYDLDEAFVIPAAIAEGHYHVGILVTDTENREVKEYRTIGIGEDGDHDHE